jgi:hypothetical protein
MDEGRADRPAFFVGMEVTEDGSVTQRAQRTSRSATLRTEVAEDFSICNTEDAGVAEDFLL